MNCFSTLNNNILQNKNVFFAYKIDFLCCPNFGEKAQAKNSQGLNQQAMTSLQVIIVYFCQFLIEHQTLNRAVDSNISK